ncbi:hypothetical protein DSECCO2_563610 [anaerobic digester metagenome]
MIHLYPFRDDVGAEDARPGRHNVHGRRTDVRERRKPLGIVACGDREDVFAVIR